MDIIYNKVTNFEEDNNFSIDLTTNNEIQNMFFKEREEWLVTGLKLKTKKFENSDEYKEIERVSDLINKIKNEKKKTKQYNAWRNTNKITNFHILILIL